MAITHFDKTLEAIGPNIEEDLDAYLEVIETELDAVVNSDECVVTTMDYIEVDQYDQESMYGSHKIQIHFELRTSGIVNIPALIDRITESMREVEGFEFHVKVV